ncbi:membrane protein involved in the export of O-antigen and teichoic acid [Marinitoga piezophila KA3]|uniref:Membrane protein involved in the export of O-antigen and teichoic acid n=1 Tax=Marinitoga piezophila (strain DSM 14283 / JCM 11233 / KA3) TaxID=443254 RepID=H2J2V0_MARPK|nr:oligosaccharide flippase family protein [Marinitoga piezophila]AEX85641.1 membrane protein involved in the export of O-antigen and teichoic acid [Marinitoga piezophila KA3]
MGKSIKKNYFYNLSYQIFSIIAPLITAPYIARIFGPEKVGIYAFINTVVNYFILFGSFSINLFASRELAYYKNDIKKRSQIFWNLVLLNFINISASLSLFYLYLFIKKPEYISYYFIQSLLFFSYMFDITWLFSSQEEFGKIALRNFVVRIISIILLFTLIKEQSDLWKYFLINSLTPVIANISLWGFIKKYIIFVKPHIKKAYSYFPRVIKVFLPTIAISIYSMLDKLMLGIFSTKTQVGYYDYSQKLVRIPLAIITSITPIIMVRMAAEFKNNDINSVKIYFYKSFKFATFLSFYLFSMMYSVVPEFIPWFFGNNFFATIKLIQIISPIIIAIALGTTAGHQFLLSIGEENKLTLALFIGAGINFTLNLFLIPKYQAIGVSLASVIAECSITIILYLFVSKYLNVLNLIKNNWYYLVFSIFTIIVVRFIGNKMGVSIITNIIQVFVGSLIYIVFVILVDKEIRNYFIQFYNTRFKNKL